MDLQSHWVAGGERPLPSKVTTLPQYKALYRSSQTCCLMLSQGSTKWALAQLCVAEVSINLSEAV